MRIILLAQITIFLFVSPIIIQASEYSSLSEYSPLLSISFVFLFAFLAGLWWARRSNFAVNEKQEFLPLFPYWVKCFVIGGSFLYIAVVISSDLFFRRQGSEYMATLHAGLSISKLLILRCYEVLFFPISIALIASLSIDKSRMVKITILALFLGFLFMGVADSRTKLLMPLVFFYMVFVVPNKKQVRISGPYLFGAFVIIVMVILLIAVGRSEYFNSTTDYIFQDIIQRTDGLELISTVNQKVDIPFHGTLDFRIFNNFWAMIPFNPESAALKADGLTSSKNFLLREILTVPIFDANNSAVADLFYFGGYIGIVVGALVYGFFVGKFDVLVSTNRIWMSRTRAALFLAFMINAWRIEMDYFSIFISTGRDFVLIYLVLLFLRLVPYGSIEKLVVLKRAVVHLR